jgi:hypothetical protein
MRWCAVLLLLAFSPLLVRGEDAPAAPGKLPHVQVDVKARQVRVECNSCNVNQDVGLEFFCVEAGTNEYESVLSSRAKASHVHLGLLMIGLQPGEPVKWSEAAKKWIPPHGPPLNITCEWKKENGEQMRVPAQRLMVSRKTKKEAPPFTWIFTGSKEMEDGKYAADAVGYLVSVLNNELTVIDIPELAGRDLDSREWDRNGALLPPVGATIWMVIEPAGRKDRAAPATTQKVDDVGVSLLTLDAAGNLKLDGMAVTMERLGQALANRRVPAKVRFTPDANAPASEVKKVRDVLAASGPAEATGTTPPPLSDVKTDEALMKRLHDLWERKVAPHDKALREAAQAHYEVIESMRREQQRLIDEADRIQRAIDELQKQYQEMTTPRPEPLSQ